MTTPNPLRILVLCTGNSCRSQMAEAWLRHLGGGRVLAYSAGTHPTGYVHPFVQRVMGEVGVQQDNARSKHVEEYLNHSFDYVITVCDNAAANCPVFQGPAKRIHWSTEDPTAARGDNEDRLAAFRSVRDGLGQRVDAFLAGDPAQD